MITREQFRKWMDTIVEAMKLLDEIAACRFFSDEMIDTFGKMLDIPIEFAQTAMGDSGWIPCWLWELECGERYDEGCVDDHGNPVKLKTIDDLYDVIMSEKGETK